MVKVFQNNLFAIPERGGIFAMLSDRKFLGVLNLAHGKSEVLEMFKALISR
jgi:hypothetical protein